MHDRVLASMIVVPVTIVVLLVLSMVLLDYWYEESPNPLDVLPKVIIDRVDNATLVTVMGVGQQRYDAIHINYTVGNTTTNVSAPHRYSMDVNVSGANFVLNVTAILKGDHYMLNCTVEVDLTDIEHTYFWIQEEEDATPARHRSPYTILAEWRDMR
jgi:hypothetical protein